MRKAKESGSGWDYGRKGSFGKSLVFNHKVKIENVPVAERLEAMIEHARLFEKFLKGTKNYNVIKKHYAVYASGFDGAKGLRTELMGTKSAKQAWHVVKRFLRKNRA